MRPAPTSASSSQGSRRRDLEVLIRGEHTLFEIVLMVRCIGRTRLRELNNGAIDDAVNLAVTLRDADQYTRRWAGANALRRSPLGAWDKLML